MTAEDFLSFHGYRRCDIAACNCNSWHGGYANDRLREIRELIEGETDMKTNGRTTIDLVRDLIACYQGKLSCA